MLSLTQGMARVCLHVVLVLSLAWGAVSASPGTDSAQSPNSGSGNTRVAGKPQPIAEIVQPIERIETSRWVKLDLTTPFRPKQQSPAQFVEEAIRNGCQAVVVGAPASMKSPLEFRDFLEQVHIARIVQPEVPVFVALEWNSVSDRAWVLFSPDAEQTDRHLLDRFPVGLTSPDSQDETAIHLAAMCDRLIEFSQSTSQRVAVLIEPRATGSRLSEILAERIAKSGSQAPLPVIGFRWTTVDALPGRTWDQLLSQGTRASTVTNALDSPEYSKLETSAPGELSETFVLVSDRTPNAIIESIGRGSVYGIHGRSVSQVEFQVVCSNLPRAARPGEVVSVPAGTPVKVMLSFQPSTAATFSRLPPPDSVELIRNERRRIPQIQKMTRVGEGSEYHFEMPMPPEEISLRCVGNSLSGEVRVFSFFTNSIVLKPVVAEPSAASRNALQRLFRNRNREFWIGIAVASVTLLLGISLATYLLVIKPAQYKKKLLADARQPMFAKSQPARSTDPPSSERSPTWPMANTGKLRRRLAFAGFITAFLIGYGSLVPFKVAPKPIADAVKHFRSIRTTPQHFFRPRADRFINIGITVPLAFLVVGSVLAKRKGVVKWLVLLPLAIALCCSVTLAVEFAQEWFPQRVPSMNDLVCQALGIVLGTVGWLAIGERLFDRWQQASQQKTGVAEFSLGLLLVMIAGFSVMPVSHPVASVQDFSNRMALIDTVPFRSVKTFAAAYQDAFEAFVSLIPLGLWVALRQRKGKSPGLPDSDNSNAVDTNWLTSLAWCAVGVASLYLLRFLLTENHGRAEMLVWGWLGAVLGVSCIYKPPSPVLLRLASFCYFVILTSYLLLPWTFQPGNEPFWERLRDGIGLPFARFHEGNDLAALDHSLRKLGWFAGIGVLVIESRWTSYRAAAIFLAAILGFLVGTIGETGQLFLPSRTPDLTDILIGVTGAILGAVIAGSVESAKQVSSTVR